MSDVSLAEVDEKGLSYPVEGIPEAGDIRKVAPGIYWVRMTLPFALDHINLWLIDDSDGWVIVDTGVNDDATKASWRNIFNEKLGGRPVKRVIVTHLHPDHVGLAGWITREFDVALEMSRTDYLMCRTLVADTGKEAPQDGRNFYRAAGFSDRAVESYAKRFGGFGERVSRLPDAFKRLKDGDQLTMGGRTWQVIVGSGHAPEHVCLFCEELNVLISGDQVLPRISSNVSLHPTEAHADPLQEWIDSCKKLKAALPADALVLPAHNEPFYGLHTRLDALVEGHEEGLAKLLEMLAEPKRAIDVFPALFKREIGPDVFFMATGESLAHLSCLVARGDATVSRDEKGVDWYVCASA
ncbi:MAG: MBL fold metallo-hydrolase [Parvibaculum sp.]|jgi:glyoxylase-like metal-dependent hydrolase (beta-lactamase superfamily II)|nr:MBL fold metallo-hydrolase [Parvibaculum sp.]|tara:strand:+ start:3507 stop:4568 length:1062 start_codon:yes stop_codon:yes gene_type:complete